MIEKTEIEKAIVAIKIALKAEPDITISGYPFHSIIDNTLKTALSALREKAEREKGCKHCNGTESEYQHTYSTKISINTFGKARTILIECNPCPPYANCGMKGIPARSAFIINFCPECGRDLRRLDE